MNKTVDLGNLTNNGIMHNLCGKSFGTQAMKKFGLDWNSIEDIHNVSIIIPTYIDSVGPSFIEGMFANMVSVIGYDQDKFNQLVEFSTNREISEQISIGLRALFIKIT